MKKKLIGKWESVSQHLIENHGSNFSNWIDQVPVKGNLVFIVKDNLEKPQVQLGIPIAGSGLKGHFIIKKGELEITKNEIKIWGESKVPFKIQYNLKNDSLILNVFERNIKFQK